MAIAYIRCGARSSFIDINVSAREGPTMNLDSNESERERNVRAIGVWDNEGGAAGRAPREEHLKRTSPVIAHGGVIAPLVGGPP